ncbi:MAG: hypothetical protein ACRCXC_06540 [Legionella sp.]
MDSEVNRKNVLETFGVVIRQISQQYLTEDWNSIEKRKEKEALYSAIIDIINKFSELSALENVTIQHFVKELLLLSFSSINHTVVLRAHGLKKAYMCLQESIDHRLIHFFSELLMQLNRTENSPAVILDEIINSDDYKALPNYPLALKITHFYTKLAGKGLEKYSIEQLTKSYEEQFAHSIYDFAKLYQHIQLFIHDIASIRSIVTADKIEVDELDLLKLANGLIATAAERFYKDRPSTLPAVTETDSFIKLVTQYVIEHFNTDGGNKENNKELAKASVESSGIISSALSFFWSPTPKRVVDAQASSSAKGEISYQGPPPHPS